MKARLLSGLLFLSVAGPCAFGDEACDRALEALKAFEEQNASVSREYEEKTISAVREGRTCDQPVLELGDRRDAFKTQRAGLAKSFVTLCRGDPHLTNEVALYNFAAILEPKPSDSRHLCQILGK